MTIDALAPEMAALLIEARDYIASATTVSNLDALQTQRDLIARIDGLTEGMNG